MKNNSFSILTVFALITVNGISVNCAFGKPDQGNQTVMTFNADSLYQQSATRELVSLVNEAAVLVQVKGETAFDEFREPAGKWRHKETYIFVLDEEGNMLVHADPLLEGKNQLDLKDINGKSIIRGLIETATGFPGQTEGWYHYQWPVPGGLLPRWKSSYVKLVTTPSGKNLIIGSGMYNDRMERGFVMDLVKNAVIQIEKNKETAFQLFRDPKSSYIVKDAYIFVIDENGVEVVNPAFASLEGRNLKDLKDKNGKLLVQEMFKVISDSGSGWVDYMWPKPGESVSTQKSTYVSKAKIGDKWLVVGCGIYPADAPKSVPTVKKMTAPELKKLVNEAGIIFEKRGEKAYPDFRRKGSKWFRDDTYFFVWSMEGERIFHAANPAGEGLNMAAIKDVHERPWGKMFLETAGTTQGEGWVHYMYPEPGDIFPAWKSSYLKRVTFPSGKQFLIGCGIYNMQMDKIFIEDVVNRAAVLVAEQGKAAFELLRDKTGPYNFMDVYVFVDTPEGIELVNPAQPGIEGMNLMDLKDANGKYAVREYINAALKNGSEWVTYYWYRPGQNTPALKHTYVRKVQSGTETFILGAGYYQEDKPSGSIDAD